MKDFRITSNLIDSETIGENSGIGARSIFEGIVRNFNDGHDVPRITPARNLYSLSYSKGSMLFKLLLKDVDKQDEIGEGETSTDGYQMLNARLTKTFDLGNSNLSVSIFGNNLLDEVARNHSSYVKSEVPLPGKNYGVKFNLNF